MNTLFYYSFIYLNNYARIVICCPLAADEVVFFRNLLNVLGALQRVPQGFVIDGIIQPIGAKQDAVERFQLNGFYIRCSTLGMAGEERTGNLGMTERIAVHMVNGTVFHVALDVNDIAAAVSRMGDGRLMALHTGHDQGCAHLTQARFFVKGSACSLCRIDDLLVRIGLIMLQPVGHQGVADSTAGHLATEVSAHPVTHDKQGPLAWDLNDATAILIILSRPCLGKLNVFHLTRSSTDYCS